MRSFYLFGSTFQGERGCSLFKPFDSSPTAEMCVFVRVARWLLLLRVPSVCRAVILLVKFRMAVGGDHPGKLYFGTRSPVDAGSFSLPWLRQGSRVTLLVLDGVIQD